MILQPQFSVPRERLADIDQHDHAREPAIDDGDDSPLAVAEMPLGLRDG